MKHPHPASQPVLTTVRSMRWEKKHICDPLSVAVRSYYDFGIINALVTVRFTQTRKFGVQLYDLSHKKRNSVILFSPSLLFLEAQTPNPSGFTTAESFKGTKYNSYGLLKEAVHFYCS